MRRLLTSSGPLLQSRPMPEVVWPDTATDATVGARARNDVMDGRMTDEHGRWLQQPTQSDEAVCSRPSTLASVFSHPRAPGARFALPESAGIRRAAARWGQPPCRRGPTSTRGAAWPCARILPSGRPGGEHSHAARQVRGVCSVTVLRRTGLTLGQGPKAGTAHPPSPGPRRSSQARAQPPYRRARVTWEQARARLALRSPAGGPN